MARYDSGRKAATRQRIITTAADRIKRDGIDGSGVATLMSDAGLTNGAFYAHFSSKDDLVAHVVAEQLRVQLDALTALPPGGAAIEDYVRDYLSPHHRDHPESGCPSAALLDEISRCHDAIRGPYTQGVQAIVDHISTLVSPHDPSTSSARTQALGLFTLLVGTLQLARAVTDPTLSDEILAAGVRNAQILMES
jgi:AcrR family transcriptional regulator